MKNIAWLVCFLQLFPSESVISENVDSSLPNEVSRLTDATGASWWWNLAVSRGGEQLYYPDHKSWNNGGSYQTWLWRNVLIQFGKGSIIKMTQPTTPSTPTTPPTPPPTTYPPLPQTCPRSDRDALGPFYWPFVPFPERDRICPESMVLDNRLDVYGYVFTKPSSDCGTMVRQANAKVEIWLADTSGTYRQECVGYVMTDAMGFYNFTSAMPGVYPGRPQHIHYQITTQDNVKFVTQMYFQSDTHRGKNPDLTVDDVVLDSKHTQAQFNFIL